MLYYLESEGFYMSDELKENIKEETPVEVEEEKPVETKPEVDPLDNSKPIEKPSEDAEPYDVAIENARLEFNKKYKAGRRNSYIAMGAVLAIAITSVIFIGLREMAFKIVGWSLVGTALVGMLVFYIVTRNILPNATKDYIEVVNQNLNQRNFSDNRFKDVSVDKNEKLELAELISDNVYKDVTNIASRNVIEGHFEDRTFRVGDCGLYSGNGKTRASLFVGKYFTLPNDLHFEGRYILNIKGSSAVDLPNDIDDLKVVLEEGDLTVYGKEGSKPASDLGKDFINAIKNVDVERHLLNLNVVVWGGHSAAYASYDDIIMALPFEKPFEKESNEQYAQNIVQVLEALALLLKKGK